VKLQVKTKIPTVWGEFEMHAFSDSTDELMPHLALVKTFDPDKPCLLRIHSECFTGDLLGSTRCDCGDQLRSSLDRIGREGGVLLYLRQEGRGIGLINKMKAYNIQDEKGLNTLDANVHLGFEPDQRTYGIGIEMLRYFGIEKVRLLTNNPEKIEFLKEGGIEIAERIPIKGIVHRENKEYLRAKRDLMGHFPDLA
jgi:GTP cyclohydrolase II